MTNEQHAPATFRRFICRTCRSTDVVVDAYAVFSEITQQWELDSTYDSAYCRQCDGETRLEEVALVPSLTLYNGCTNQCAPDWTLFNGIEINCCEEDLAKGVTDTSPLHRAQFYTVYGHLIEGGVQAITDVTTRRIALAIARRFAAEAGDLPILDSCTKI